MIDDKTNEEIAISFDFATGDIELVFEKEASHVYKSELGTDIAELFDELIEEAFEDYLKKNKRLQRLKNIN